MRGIVESPTLNERFFVGNSTSIVDAYCPIDRTQLVSVIEYDFSNYSCVACGATYEYGDRNLDSLREQATKYVNEIKRRAEDQGKELAKLERIIQAAQKNGVL